MIVERRIHAINVINTALTVRARAFTGIYETCSNTY